MDVKQHVGWNGVSYAVFFDIDLPLAEVRNRLAEAEAAMVAAGAAAGTLELRVEAETEYGGYERVFVSMVGSRPLTRKEKAAVNASEKEARAKRADQLRAELARLEA